MKFLNTLSFASFVFLTCVLNACSKAENEFAISVPNQETIKADTDIETIVSIEGLKNVTFGMSETEANAAFTGGLQRLNSVIEEGDEDCYYLTPKHEDPSVDYTFLFMVLSGTVQRIDIASPDIVTERGAKVGMTFSAVEALYPNTQRKPNVYSHPNEDLIVQLDKSTKAIFEYRADEIVSDYRVGKMPAIEFVEGCQ